MMPAPDEHQGARQPAGPERIREQVGGYLATTHAVARFRDRVRPGLGWEAAEAEMLRLAQLTDPVPEPPAWFARRAHATAERYLVLGDLVFPLARSSQRAELWLIASCIPRGTLSDRGRQERRRQRAEKRRARRRVQANRTTRRHAHG
jgi:hypothetical protein